jgi:hypothetical protein
MRITFAGSVTLSVEEISVSTDGTESTTSAPVTTWGVSLF